MVLRALLWDVDGTLAETERDGHRLAFNRAFAQAGLPIVWDPICYGRWLGISGGHERIAAQLLELEGAVPDPARVTALQAAKQIHYRQLLGSGALQLRPGVAELLQEAYQAGLVQAIVTTSGRSAVQGLMDQLPASLAAVFSFWICGEDVRCKKPDPEAYDQALRRLLRQGSVSDTEQVLVIEDSAAGLRAAVGAGLPCLLTLSHYGADSSRPDWPAARAVVSELGPAVRVLKGPPCSGESIALTYLQGLLQ